MQDDLIHLVLGIKDNDDDELPRSKWLFDKEGSFVKTFEMLMTPAMYYAMILTLFF
jgi:hypothetical protein